MKSMVSCCGLVEGCGFAKSSHHPARHSLRNWIRKSTASAAMDVKNSKQLCRFLNSSPFMYLRFVFMRIISQSSPAFAFLPEQGLCRVALLHPSTSRPAANAHSLKTMCASGAASAEETRFTVSEHCHGGAQATKKNGEAEKMGACVFRL